MDLGITGPERQAAAPVLTPTGDLFPNRWRAVLAYGLLGAVLLLTLIGPVVSAWRARPIEVAGLGPLELFAAQLLLALFLASWFVLQVGRSAREFLHLPSGRWSARIATGIRIGITGWLLTLTAMAIFGALARTADVTPAAGFAEVMVWIARRPLGVRLLLVGVAMVVEEAFFRAFLQPRIGLIAATACFAASHLQYGSPVMGAGVFVIGLVLGVTFRRHDDLVICAVAHGTFDAIQLFVVLPLVARQFG